MTVLKNRFSPPANRVFLWTKAEVERLDHLHIEPEHLLLGLLNEERGLAYHILKSLQVDFGSLEKELHQSLLGIRHDSKSELEMTDSTKKVLELSMESSAVLQRPYLGTEHLLIGLLRSLANRAYPILRRAGVSYNQVLSKVKEMPWEGRFPRAVRSQVAEEVGITPGEKLNLVQIVKMVSSVFWGLTALTVLAGISAYRGWLAPGYSVFLFVTLGWIVSLSLHEFGHALVAYWGGDFSIINKGYLTLNPLRYTHGFLSVVVPLIYLALGGIGLPGGAVYIDKAAIPSKRMQSLVSGGGPIMTTVFTGVLAIPFVFGLQGGNWWQHKEFWAGLSFLTFLQISSLFFNLLPIPGLDGFGIILPYLPPSLVARIGSLGSLTFLIIFFFFFQDTPIRRGFWTLVGLVSSLIGIDSQLIVDGFGIYRFW